MFNQLILHRCLTQVVLKTASETAEEDADSLIEPDWKKIVVDSNAVLLMSGNHNNDNYNYNDNDYDNVIKVDDYIHEDDINNDDSDDINENMIMNSLKC